MSGGGITVEALSKHAQALAEAGNPSGALEVLDGAIALRPDLPGLRFQRGLVRLAIGDFAGGWEDYEARWASERFVRESRGLVPPVLIPDLAVRPTAADLAGKRVLLIGEQAIGDQVMFASMLPDLARTAASVFCVCEGRLAGLFAGSFPDVVFASPKEAVVDSDQVDVTLAMGSLGHAFRRSAADFPGATYLTAPPALQARWEARLGLRAGRLRVGLSWRGGAATTRREARSLSLAQMAPALDLAGCQFVSLQYGDVADELAQLNAGRAEPVLSFPAAETDDFAGLAGLASAMDLVVSVQNSLVHLCGALGTACLTLAPQPPEWRYMAEGPSMPWYRSVRILRQPAAGDWGPVIDAAAAELRARV